MGNKATSPGVKALRDPRTYAKWDRDPVDKQNCRCNDRSTLIDRVFVRGADGSRKSALVNYSGLPQKKNGKRLKCLLENRYRKRSTSLSFSLLLYPLLPDADSPSLFLLLFLKRKPLRNPRLGMRGDETRLSTNATCPRCFPHREPTLILLTQHTHPYPGSKRCKHDCTHTKEYAIICYFVQPYT